MQCGGSWRCPNPKCLFLKEKGLCNDVQFTEGQNKTCFVCEEEATFVRCPAVKIWEFSTDKTEVDIHHFGYHTSRATPDKQNLQVESKLEEDFQKTRFFKTIRSCCQHFSLHSEENWQYMGRNRSPSRKSLRFYLNSEHESKSEKKPGAEWTLIRCPL